MSDRITPEVVLQAYAGGVFPMANPYEDDTIYWYSPDPRAIIPLDAYRIPRSVSRAARRFVTSVDRAFETVVRNSAARSETWISGQLEAIYIQLHTLGYAHSVEVWSGTNLVGGLYGVSLGGAFFGESMYHVQSNASNVALADLIGRLVRSGYVLLDTQYLTDHLARFGAIEITRGAYLELLQDALGVESTMVDTPGPILDTPDS